MVGQLASARVGANLDVVVEDKMGATVLEEEAERIVPSKVLELQPQVQAQHMAPSLRGRSEARPGAQPARGQNGVAHGKVAHQVARAARERKRGRPGTRRRVLTWMSTLGP